MFYIKIFSKEIQKTNRIHKICQLIILKLGQVAWTALQAQIPF